MSEERKLSSDILGEVEKAIFCCAVERTVNLESENLDGHPGSIPY